MKKSRSKIHNHEKKIKTKIKFGIKTRWKKNNKGLHWKKNKSRKEKKALNRKIKWNKMFKNKIEKQNKSRKIK
jgi:phosphoserine aminotransferase